MALPTVNLLQVAANLDQDKNVCVGFAIQCDVTKLEIMLKYPSVGYTQLLFDLYTI